tara:strand:+ start:7259 stop:8335 length:1077 start_codon:yes stop_codon:yes gene_type:complete
MKTYIKFLSKIFLSSFFYVSLVTLSLIFILNLLTELEFFKEFKVNSLLPIYMSLLNSPTFIFELFPFIFLISTQLFFISLFNNDELNIFKYSGLKNSKILLILSSMSLVLGFFIVIIFYNFSSNLKNFYLDLKTSYTSDGKYLAVINKNGLWIKDIIGENTLLINASKIEQNFIIDAYISEFNKDFKIIKNIMSPKIDVKNKEWVSYDSSILMNNNETKKYELYKIKTNFNYHIIQNLFSNLSSLSFLELLELRKNYKQLNYSLVEVDLHLFKLVTFPVYLVLMTIFASIIMLNTKKFKSSILKISIGLFFSVIIYYLNNFFNILGQTEKINLLASVIGPLILLVLVNSYLMRKINAK